MGIVWGAEGALWLNPMLQTRGTELFFILWRAQDGAWHWTQTRQAARGHHAFPNMRVRTCLCIGMCVSAVSEPQDAHPPISRNRAEHEILGERWDPAAGVAGLCCLSEGMWSAVLGNDNVLLKTPKRSLGESCLAGRRSADYVGTGLLAVCSHCWVETTGDSISIVLLSSVLTFAHSGGVWFCALLRVWQRVKEHWLSKEVLTLKCCKTFQYIWAWLQESLTLVWLLISMALWPAMVITGTDDLCCFERKRETSCDRFLTWRMREGLILDAASYLVIFAVGLPA